MARVQKWVLIGALALLGLGNSGQQTKEPKHLKRLGDSLKQPPPKIPSGGAAPQKASGPSPQGGPRASTKADPDNRHLPTPTPAEAACEQPIALEKLFTLPEARQPVAGKTGIFFLRNQENGEQALYFRKSLQGPEKAVEGVPPGVEGMQPSPDGQHLLVWGGDSSPGLWLVSEPNRVLAHLSQKRVHSAVWNGPEQAIAASDAAQGSGDTTLSTIEIPGGAVQEIANLPGQMALMDVEPKGKAVLLVSMGAETRGRLAMWNAAAGVRTLMQTTGTTFLKAFFGPDGQSAFYLAQSKGRGGLAWLRVSPPAVPKPLTPASEDVLNVTMNRARTRLVYSSRLPSGESALSAWTLSPQGSPKRKHPTPPPRGWTVDPAAIPTTPGSDEVSRLSFYFARSSPSEPSQIWFWDGRQERVWAEVPGAAQSEACWAAQSVAARGREQWRIWLPKKTPTPVAFFTVATEQNASRFRPLVTYLNQRGFGVAMVSPDELEAARSYLIQEGLTRKDLIADIDENVPVSLDSARDLASKVSEPK